MTSAQKVIDTIQTYIRNTDERNNKPELTSSSWYLPNRAGFVKSIFGFGEGDTDPGKSRIQKMVDALEPLKDLH